MSRYFPLPIKMNTLYKCLFTLLTTAVAFTAQAQQAVKTAPIDYVKSYVGVFGGISSPISDFKQLDYSNNKAGFAKRGAMFGIDGAVYVYKNLAVGASVSFQDQGELTQDDATALATGYTESFKSDQATVTTEGRYHSYSFMLGPQYSIPFYKGFIVDIRIAGGLLTTKTTPGTTIVLSGTPTQTTPFYQTGGLGSAFAYSTSLALRYKLGNGVSVVLKGNRLSSQGPDVFNGGRTDNDPGRYVTRQPFTAIQTTLGFNFMF